MASLSEEKAVLETVNLVYGAVQDPELLETLLERVAGHTRSDSVALFAAPTHKTLPTLFSKTGMSDAVWCQYVEYFAGVNVMMHRCESTLAADTTWLSQAVVEDQEADRLEFYADFFHPNGLHYAAGLRVNDHHLAPANLSCQRSKRSGPYDKRTIDFLSLLRPHLQRALSLRGQFHTLEVVAYGVEEALDSYGHPALIVDGEAKILFASKAAERLLSNRRMGLQSSQNHLVCDSPGPQEEMQEIIRSAASPVCADPAPGALLLSAAAGQLRIVVLPFTANRRRLVLVFLCPSNIPTLSRAALLRSLYKLSPTEARLTNLLCMGDDLFVAANKLRITRESARTYLKRVLHKTSASRQADLVRLVLSLPCTSNRISPNGD